jgi:hypothetical protein
MRTARGFAVRDQSPKLAKFITSDKQEVKGKTTWFCQLGPNLQRYTTYPKKIDG